MILVSLAFSSSDQITCGVMPPQVRNVFVKFTNMYHSFPIVGEKGKLKTRYHECSSKCFKPPQQLLITTPKVTLLHRHVVKALARKSIPHIQALGTDKLQSQSSIAIIIRKHQTELINQSRRHNSSHKKQNKTKQKKR